LNSVVAFKPKVKHPLDDRGYGFDFECELEAGEIFTSVASVTVSGPDSELVIGAYSVSVATTIDDDGNPVAAGLVIVVQISAGTAGADYRITVAGPTNMGNTIVGVGVMQVRDGLP
jgi:hypothetical protein